MSSGVTRGEGRLSLVEASINSIAPLALHSPRVETAFGSNCATKSALVAFDAFEKQVNMHHIVANRGDDVGVKGGGLTAPSVKIGGGTGAPITTGLSPGKMKKKVRRG